MDLIRLNVLPPAHGTPEIASLMIASPATRLVRSLHASPWEVFLCPDKAARFAIHFNARPKKRG